MFGYGKISSVQGEQLSVLDTDGVIVDSRSIGLHRLASVRHIGDSQLDPLGRGRGTEGFDSSIVIVGG